MRRLDVALFVVAVAGIVALGIGCFSSMSKGSAYYQSTGSNTAYRFNPDGFRTTATGIRLYDPKGEVDDVDISAVVARVEACAANLAPTPEQIKSGGCPVGVAWNKHGMRRDWFTVAIAPDWHVSSCTGKQLFPCYVSGADCRQAQAEKDLGGLGTCPCECRGTVQEQTHVVVTPNLELLPGMLFTLVTGCINPWQAPFSACTAPPLL